MSDSTNSPNSTTPLPSMPSVASNEFSEIITLVEYFLVTIVNAVSLAIFLRILFSLFKRAKRITIQEKNGLSNLLITNLVCWTILLASGLPHNLWMIGNWRPFTRFVNAYFMFWSIMVTQCMMSTLPFSVFFLSLDRTFSIKYWNGYREEHKLALLAICLGTLSLVFLTNLIVFLQVMPLPQQTSCIVFACLMTTGNNGFIISKILGAILIIISGAYFLYKLHQRQKSIQGGNGTNPQTAPTMYGGRGGALTATDGQIRQSKINTNKLVLLMLTTEVLVNFIPQLLVLIIQQFIVHCSIASYLGPHNLSLCAIDALITSLIYRHTLRRIIGSPNGSSINPLGNNNLARSSRNQLPNINVAYPVDPSLANRLQQQRRSTLFTVTT